MGYDVVPGFLKKAKKNFFAELTPSRECPVTADEVDSIIGFYVK